MWWVLPCTAALSGIDQPSARVCTSLDPWTQTGLRLVVARSKVAGRGRGGGGVNDGLPARCPSFSNSVIMLRCTSCYSGTTIGSSYSTAHLPNTLHLHCAWTALGNLD